MFDFKKVKVRKTRLFFVDLYSRDERAQEKLEKQNIVVVATRHGLVKFEDIKDFSKDELSLYESNGYIAHFVINSRPYGCKVAIKNIRPIFMANDKGYISYKQLIKYLGPILEGENEK